MPHLTDLIPPALKERLETTSQAKLSVQDMAARAILQRINQKLSSRKGKFIWSDDEKTNVRFVDDPEGKWQLHSLPNRNLNHLKK